MGTLYLLQFACFVFMLVSAGYLKPETVIVKVQSQAVLANSSMRMADEEDYSEENIERLTDGNEASGAIKRLLELAKEDIYILNR